MSVIKKTVCEENVWVAPGARLMGHVTVGRDSSIWYNAVVRGDEASISIGKGSNIQDNCVIHADHGDVCSVGDGTTIGHSAIIHGCRVGDNTVIGMEANPPIYNTNYINDTKAALDLIEKVGSIGFKLNLDVGTMIANKEDISVLSGREHLINHVHISEPGLKPIEQRWLHKELSELLNNFGYNGFVSIEVGKQENVAELDKMMRYTEEIFG